MDTNTANTKKDLGRKTKVLCVCESPLLPSGLGTYGRELLSRLCKCDDLEVVALATDVLPGDPALLDLPYKVIANKVDDTFDSRFGAASFTESLLRERPQVVIGWRDWTQEQFIFQHPYRKHYRHIWMTTCDALPRPRQELSHLLSCDSVLGYTDWSGAELTKACGRGLAWGGSAPPAADYTLFKPRHEEAEAAKSRFGLLGRTIVGTVQRNQFRKCLPELIHGMSCVTRERCQAVLWLHTTYPDSSGFDLPLHLRDSGMLSRCLLTYICQHCGEWWPSPYQGVSVSCRHCERGIAVPPSVTSKGGLSPSDLALLMNCFDVYAHFATNEGFGMPLLEAAACGKTLVGVDHTATGEILRNLGVPEELRVKPAFRFEQGSERKLAALDPSVIAGAILKSLNSVDTHEYAERARSAYSYDRSAEVWKSAINRVAANPPLSWDSPLHLPPLPEIPPEGISGLEFSKIAHSACPTARPFDVLVAAQRLADGRQTRESLWDSLMKASLEYRSVEGRRFSEMSGVKVRSVLGSLS